MLHRRWLRYLRPGHFLLPISLCLVFLAGFLNFRNDRDLKQSAAELGRLNGLLSANAAVLSALTDLETGQRGYLLTGEPAYLEPYQQASGRLPRLLEKLRVEMVQPRQQERYSQLENVIADRRAEMSATILMRGLAGTDAALTIVKTESGRNSMDAIRRLSGEINQQTQETLAANANTLLRRQNGAAFTSLGITCSLFLLLSLAAAMIQRGVRRRDDLIGLLDNSRQQLHTTLSSIGDGVVVTDAEGRITFINPVAARISGWDSKTVTGRKADEVLPLLREDTREPIDHPVLQVLRDKKPSGIAPSTVLIRQDGTEIPVDDSAAIIPVSDGSGRAGPSIFGVVMVIRDITGQRMAENSVRQWEQVFDDAGFGIAMLSLDGVPSFQEVNPAFARMHGYTRDEVRGTPMSALVMPAALPEKMKSLYEAGASGRVVIETVHRRRDGSTFPVIADVTVVRDAAGNAIYGTAYYSDITERRKAEDELRSNEARFRTLADSLPHLVWTTLPDGSPDYFNVRWQNSDNDGALTDSKRGWHDFLHPDDRDSCLHSWNDALQKGTVFQTECRLRQQGEDRWHICRAVPVRDNDGKIVRWFGSCTDIHDNRQVADALRVSKDDLQRSNLDLEQFAFAASHDMQEPLRMVVVYSQLLKEEFASSLGEAGVAYLNFAVEGALRVESLILDLLAYSRASAPADEQAEGVLVGGTVSTAIENLNLQITQTQATVEVGELPVLNVPKLPIVIVFQNLISNAIKYRQPGVVPFITISADPRPGEWVFSVKDNGIGIDPQYHDQIFRVFRRLHGAEYPGTGIGLALCQRLIERHGGKIWIESGDTGSTFCFTLPAR